MKPTMLTNGLRNTGEIKKTVQTRTKIASTLTLSQQLQDKVSSATPRIDERLQSKRFPFANRRHTIDSECKSTFQTMFRQRSPKCYFDRMKQASAKNPQQEALARQQQILEQIEHVSASPSNLLSKSYVIKPRKLEPRQCTLGEQQQPSRRNANRPSATAAISKRGQIETSNSSPEAIQRQSMGPLNRASVTAGRNQGIREPKSFLETLMPRILVSEAGSLVNLTVNNNESRSDFQTTNTSVALHVGNSIFAERVKREQNNSKCEPRTEQSTPMSMQNHTQDGIVQTRVDSAVKKNYQSSENSQYLVELMRPFASKAGTQGMVVKNNILRQVPQTSQESIRPQRKHAQFASLIASQVYRRTINTRCQRQKPSVVTAGLIHQSDEEEATENQRKATPKAYNCSLDTKRSPFRQPSVEGESMRTLQQITNELKFASQNPLPRDKPGNISPDFSTLQSGTGTLTTLLGDSVAIFDDAQKQTRSAKRKKLSIFEQMSSKNDISPLERCQISTDLNDGAIDLPYMTENSRFWQYLGRQQARQTKSIRAHVKKLPLKVKEELQQTQASQLFDFYEAVLQPSITPFTELPEVSGIAPKIGDKVSMLSSVRETLTKRFQLAKAARIEAHRRRLIIAQIRALRLLIEQQIMLKPTQPSGVDVKTQFLARIGYRETTLIVTDIKELLHEVIDCRVRTERILAALKIQTWTRMITKRLLFKETLRGLRKLQRCWRISRLRKLITQARAEQKQRAALVLQRQLRGYLAYNRYFAKLKGTMTKKNLDYIINRYADAKAFMLECLQVRLAYLTRKLIKKREIEAEERRLAEIAEKKRIAQEKERQRLLRLHEKRKQTKKKVKRMLAEFVEICYSKEDKRREEAFAKDKRKNAVQQSPKPVNPARTKWDIPMEPVFFLYKQDLFEECYKKIKKRASKKKRGKNHDLNLSTKNPTTTNTPRSSAVDPATSVAVKNPASAATQQNPVSLDPHHIQIQQGNQKLIVQKFDKHPDPKRRRRESVTIECSLDCLLKEQEKYIDPFYKIGTPLSGQLEGPLSPPKSRPALTKLPEQMVNISITPQIGSSPAPTEGEIGVIRTAPEEEFQRHPPLTPATSPAGSKAIEIAGITPFNSIIQEEPRALPNVDLTAVDVVSQDVSGSSEELSINSETFDFLNVVLPIIRPKVSEHDDRLEESGRSPSMARRSTLKPTVGAKGFFASLKRRRTTVATDETKPSELKNLITIPSEAAATPDALGTTQEVAEKEAPTEEAQRDSIQESSEHKPDYVMPQTLEDHSQRAASSPDVTNTRQKFAQVGSLTVIVSDYGVAGQRPIKKLEQVVETNHSDHMDAASVRLLPILKSHKSSKELVVSEASQTQKCTPYDIPYERQRTDEGGSKTVSRKVRQSVTSHDVFPISTQFMSQTSTQSNMGAGHKINKEIYQEDRANSEITLKTFADRNPQTQSQMKLLLDPDQEQIDVQTLHST